jgi:LPPG:FO 2-phospho-L-lactate transferase
MMDIDFKVVALCGGVGGSKLAYGLNRLLGPNLTVVVNNGDDFVHLGLSISPDLDTVVYTLSELADEERGWGRADESWNLMESLSGLGGDTWFRLGDRDLALHLLRTRALSAGITLTEFTRSITSRLKIAANVLPMTDDPFATTLVTEDGTLSFQKYFVELQAKPKVLRITFGDFCGAYATDQVLDAIRTADAIIICPSNPYLSVDPILHLPGVLPAIRHVKSPKIAVSPLVGGHAVKGPTAKIMTEFGLPTNCVSIAKHYPFLDGLIIDRLDRADEDRIEIPVHSTNTVMRSKRDRGNLAAECLDFIARIRNEPKLWPTWLPGV